MRCLFNKESCNCAESGVHEYSGEPPDAVFRATATVTHTANSNPTEGTKFDQEKPMMALLAPEGVIQEAQGMTYGSKKYGPANWRKGITITRLLSASLRHIFQFLGGQDFDPESGLNHLAHAKCNLGMAIQMLKDRPDLDDRFKNAQ